MAPHGRGPVARTNKSSSSTAPYPTTSTASTSHAIANTNSLPALPAYVPAAPEEGVIELRYQDDGLFFLVNQVGYLQFVHHVDALNPRRFVGKDDMEMIWNFAVEKRYHRWVVNARPGDRDFTLGKKWLQKARLVTKSVRLDNYWKNKAQTHVAAGPADVRGIEQSSGMFGFNLEDLCGTVTEEDFPNIDSDDSDDEWMLDACCHDEEEDEPDAAELQEQMRLLSDRKFDKQILREKRAFADDEPIFED